ncbi:MAG: hypothetical protein M1819_004299 [Sarea resinae]|nr:MAG: hypothetical protein M1819_004299 [Sarea resinae]
MSKYADGLGERRRRSMGFFTRPSIAGLTPVHDNRSDPTMLKKKRRPASFFTAAPDLELDRAQLKNSRTSDETVATPRARPRTLLKSGRPSSIFGSLRSVHSVEDDDKCSSPVSRTPSIEEEASDPSRTVVGGRNVLRHGEVQTTGGMFRKRKEYLVLTETHLVRFKNQSRASEMFPSIPASLGRSNTMRHASTTSVGSAQDLQSVHSHSSADSNFGISLDHIIAVYKLEDGKPFFSVEVSHLDEGNHASALILQLNDPREAELWLTSIRATALKARLQDPDPFTPQSVEYIARLLELECDYEPLQFRIFKVVQRASNKSSGRSSSDDLQKLSSTVCYLAFGMHKLHLIPLPKQAPRTSSPSLTDLNSRACFGITTLTSISVNPSDDAFELVFRKPLCHSQSLHLASLSSSDIALWLRQAVEYLRPEWIEQPLTLYGLRGLEDDILPVDSDAEDHKCFDRTLIAYCAAYGIDTSNICYMINYMAEDAPQFELLAPANARRPKYSALELIAVLRALRYNESFRSISFRSISLDVLHGLRDIYGTEHVPWTTRSGMPLNIKGQGQTSLLVQEVRALALKSKRLRRMDFSFCITRKPRDDDGGIRDPGCGIAEALFPLCRKQLTNVDWIVLSGIELGESDLDYLVDAAVEKACHFRALEISRCGLTDRSMQLILNAMLSQDNTMESIDISGNLARLSPSTFQGQIGHFGFIRKINFSRVHRTSGPEPLIAPETLLTWRLEELNLSETQVNEQTVDSISAYLASSKSDTLRELRLNQCGLTSKDVAVFMHSMTREPGKARNLHLHVSENRLEKDHGQLVRAVAHGLTPSHLTMKMVEYQKEDHFRELVQALRKNTTLKYLDISKASLPYDASDDTCEALQLMFAENETLEELDISGEHAHLEVAKFGIGLNHALTGLEKNKALKILRIEYQKLGLQGAGTLSSVLERNTTLREIYCEHNDINLQGLTVLVNGLASNNTVLYLPSMGDDHIESLQTVEHEVKSIRSDNAPHPSRGPVRRTLAAVSSKSSKSTPHQPVYTEQDIQAAVRLIDDKWERQTKRLEFYLARNLNLAEGIPMPSLAGEEIERPLTATSLGGILEKVKTESTPTIEKELIFGADLSEKIGFSIGDVSESAISDHELHI